MDKLTPKFFCRL